MLKKTSKLMKLMFSLVFIMLFLFSANVTAAAANTSVDMYKTGSITVTLKDSGKNPVPGGTFVIYQVAGVTNQDGNLSYNFTSDFINCGISLSNLNADGLAEELNDYIIEYKVKGTTKAAENSGSVVFKDLTLGLFLIRQEGQISGYYPISPFLVSVPMTNAEGTGWIYDVDATPKTEVKQEEKEPVKLTVKKVWADKGKEHPESVTAGLYADDTLKEKVVLNDKNNWTYTWTNLDGNKKWMIKEINVPKGYVVSYNKSDTLITMTNTSTLIQTGQLNWPIPVLILTGLVLIFAGIALLHSKRKTR